DQLERQPLGVTEARRPRSAERLAHALELATRQAIAEGKDRRPVDPDHLRLSFLDHLLEQQPLLVPPELRLAAVDRIGDGLCGRAGVEQPTLRRATKRD